MSIILGGIWFNLALFCFVFLFESICSMSIGPEAVSSSASNFAVDRPIDFLNSGNFKTLSCGEPSGGINKL